MIDFDQLRRDIRHRRRQLGMGAQCRSARKLANRIRQLDVYRNSNAIALYLASDGEISCQFLLSQAWKDGKKCYLPVIAPGPIPAMRFIQYTPVTPLVMNRYKIPEPKSGAVLKAQGLDLVITPLVAFDSQSNRIGMGGGYYDRTFAFRGKSPRPVLLGVAHRLQKVNSIKPQPWDVSLDRVVYE